jgi:Holliday junction resolvase RusA-like endonuclease
MTTPITIDLPVPPSVNRTRKVDWRSCKAKTAWTKSADALVLAAKCRQISPIILAKHKTFELLITLSEHHTKIDLDNGIKWLIDYLRRIELIEDDGPKHLRRLTVEWGLAPEGARVTVTPVAA